MSLLSEVGSNKNLRFICLFYEIVISYFMMSELSPLPFLQSEEFHHVFKVTSPPTWAYCASTLGNTKYVKTSRESLCTY